MKSYDDLPGRADSCWNATAGESAWPALPPDGATADVAVIGGGIVGATAALLLARAGRSVVLLESRRIARQVTGGATVKVTSQHGVLYGHLVSAFGEEAARVYAAANEAALAWIAEQVQALAIDCAFERRAAHVWCETAAAAASLREEAETARRLGLPASFVETTELPFPVAGTLRFDNQAQFHPVRYVDGLAAAAQASGNCRIFEQTRVLDVHEGRPCRIDTDRGTVTASEVIVATNLPVLDRGGFFAKAAPKRHACLAFRLDGPAPFQDMYISAEEPTRSLRIAAPEGQPLLIAVGEAFKTGTEDLIAKFGALEDWVRARFSVGDVAFRWGNQDYYSADRVPYVGRLTPLSRHVRVATGFSAWGVTNGTVAAMILADDVLGRGNPWAATFDAQRIKPLVSGPELVKENVQVAAAWVKDRLGGKAERGVESLAPGEGGIVHHDGEDVAAYRDPLGELHMVSPVCTHMGCVVAWNAGERSWDCPCHGSRFGVDGSALNGPAVKDLKRKGRRR